MVVASRLKCIPTFFFTKELMETSLVAPVAISLL